MNRICLYAIHVYVCCFHARDNQSDLRVEEHCKRLAIRFSIDAFEINNLFQALIYSCCVFVVLSRVRVIVVAPVVCGDIGSACTRF